MTRFWVWLFLFLFLSLVMGDVIAYGEEAPKPKPFVDEQCYASFSCNSKTIIWELIVNGLSVPIPEDLSEKECEELKDTLAPIFTDPVCRPRMVEREES